MIFHDKKIGFLQFFKFLFIMYSSLQANPILPKPSKKQQAFHLFNLEKIIVNNRKRSSCSFIYIIQHDIFQQCPDTLHPTTSKKQQAFHLFNLEKIIVNNRKRSSCSFIYIIQHDIFQQCPDTLHPTTFFRLDS